MRVLHARLRRGCRRRRDAALAIVLPRRATIVGTLARRAGHLAMRVRLAHTALATVLPRRAAIVGAFALRAGHLAMRVRLARRACLGERLDGFVPEVRGLVRGMLGAAHQRGRQRRPDAALAIVLPRRTTIVGTLARRAGHLA